MCESRLCLSEEEDSRDGVSSLAQEGAVVDRFLEQLSSRPQCLVRPCPPTLFHAQSRLARSQSVRRKETDESWGVRLLQGGGNIGETGEQQPDSFGLIHNGPRQRDERANERMSGRRSRGGSAERGEEWAQDLRRGGYGHERKQEEREGGSLGIGDHPGALLLCRLSPPLRGLGRRVKSCRGAGIRE